MAKFVALLRGINVGGHRKIKMAELKQLHEAMGHENVSTYLQSGNVVFECSNINRPELIKELEKQYETDLGVKPHVILRDTDEFQQSLDMVPFPPNEEREAKFLHGFFLSGTPKQQNIDVLMAYSGPELIKVIGDMVYVYYNHGSGNSKFTLAYVEKSLGLRGTARNWNSISKILDLMTN